MALRAVDLDLFVNSASKGWNDGAKVPSPFASFVNAVSEGIDQNYKNELAAQQTEQIRINNEMAKYEEPILEAKAERARIESEAMRENPDAFKETIIKKAELDKAENDRKLAIAMQKNEAETLLKSGDGIAQGEKYTSGAFDDYFRADPKAKEAYIHGTMPNWDSKDQNIYFEKRKKEQAVETNLQFQEEATALFDKYKPDYLNSAPLNSLRSQIEADTGKPLSDADLFREGRMVTISAAPQMAVLADDKGKPLLDSKGGYKQAPPGVTEGVAYVPDEIRAIKGTKETRTVFSYGGKSYEYAGGFDKESASLFTNMKSYWLRKNFEYKDQGGDGDLKAQIDAKKKAETDAIAASQAKANQSAQEVQTQREAFVASSPVEVQEWYKKQMQNIEPTQIQSTPVATATATQTATSTPTAVVSKVPEGISTATPVATIPGSPALMPQILPTGTATPLTTQAPATPTPSGVPASAGMTPQVPQAITPEQKNLVIKKQAEAAKANQLLSKRQQNNKIPTPPVSQTAQAAVTSKSAYVPPQVQTDIQYAPDVEGINAVKNLPEMQGLSAFSKAVAVHESRGKREATSPTDVKGIMQVTETTGKSVNPNFDRTNSVHQAITGAFLLDKWLGKYSNNPMLAAAAYNGGELVVNQAIRLAGTTDWRVVKNYMEEAGRTPVVQAAWRRDFERARDKNGKKYSESKIRQLLETKPIETATYAEKVIVNFPSFAFTPDDNAMLNTLKQQGVFKA